MVRIRKQIREMEPSPTIAVTALAQRMRARGEHVISFAAGQPDFATPEHIVEAAFAAVRDGLTGYTASAGLPELRECVARHYSQSLGLHLGPENVVAAVGGKNAIGLYLSATLSDGDEVIVPAPYWVSYPPMVQLAGGRVRVVECSRESGFRMTPDDLDRAAGPDTRLLILNSPSNPTGAVYDAEAMRALCDRALALDIAVLSDEIYEHLLWDGLTHVSPLALAPERLDGVSVVSGVSKSFSMTGWRLGWLIAHEEVCLAAAKLVGHGTSGPATFIQKAGVAALDGDRGFLDDWRVLYQERRDVMLEGISRIPGMTPFMPRGAFYLWVDVRPLLGSIIPGGETITGSVGLASWLIERSRVATVPGSAFGAEGWLRLSFAASLDDVREGVARIAEAVSGLEIPRLT